MHHRLVGLALLGALAGACEGPGGSATAPGPSASAAVPSAAVPAAATPPETPSQRAPWTPPEVRIPADAIGAARTLFEQGLADPRGLAYRRVEIEVGSVWSNKGKAVATRAWVLPGLGAQAVAWNGLVYPVAHAGEPASLAEDVRAMLAHEEEARAAHLKNNPGRRFDGPSIENDEESLIAPKYLGPVHIALLLRLGEAELATRAYEVWAARQDPSREENIADLLDPYRAMAGSFLWALFDRAITAHMRRADGLALTSARALAAARESVEAECNRRGYKRREAYERPGLRLPHFDHLGPVDALLRDQERRARRDPEPPVDAGASAGLVAELDELSVLQTGQPGGLALSSDPTFTALSSSSSDLLWEIYERDDRLTRSVSFHRDFMPYRSVLSVRGLAWRALTQGLPPGAPPPEPSRPSTRAKAGIADAVEAQRGRIRIDSPEGWYRRLADGGAAPDVWIEAASRITWRRTWKGQEQPMEGEALREGRSPSVTELFARRTAEVRSVWPACQLVPAFARWDPAAALPSARETMARALEASRYAPLGACIGRLAAARAAAGDADALSAYARFLEATSPDRESLNGVEDLFAPLWLFAEDERMKAAAERLFADGTPWQPPLAEAARHGFDRTHRLSQLAASRLVGVAPFKQHVLRALGDRRPIGKLTIGPNRRLETTYDAAPKGWSSTTYARKEETEVPPDGRAVVIRVADHVAMQIAERRGAPPFKPFWPEPRRDAAIQELTAWVRAARAAP